MILLVGNLLFLFYISPFLECISIPNVQVVSPADCQEVVRAVQAISKSKVPKYLRLTGTLSMPIVNDIGYAFDLGKFVEFSQGSDATIIATGSMV